MATTFHMVAIVSDQLLAAQVANPSKISAVLIVHVTMRFGDERRRLLLLMRRLLLLRLVCGARGRCAASRSAPCNRSALYARP